jgi:hypothetical protein
MHLKEQAGWNQTEADWLRLLAMQPDGCFVADLDSSPVATATACVFGNVAWVAMVLVDVALRGQGIGKAIMAHTLNFLEERHVPTIRLDATTLGQPLYHKLGFVPEYTVTRFEGRVTPTHHVGPNAACNSERLASLIACDRQATGTDRSKLLTRLAREYPHTVLALPAHGPVESFMMTRPGSNAWTLGPCIATHISDGNVLLNHALDNLAGQDVLIDIPEHHDGIMSAVRTRGLTVQREFVRMRRGEPIAEQLPRLCASSGPEAG